MTTDIDTGAGYQEGQIGGPDAEAPPTTPTTPTETPAGDDKPKGDAITALVQQRAATRDNNNQMQGEIAALRGEIASLRQQPAAAQEEPQAFVNPHDPVEAPVDYLKAEIEGIKADVQNAKSSVGADVQQAQQVNALNDYERAVHTQLQEVAETAPVVIEAHNYVLAQYTKMAKAQGIRGPEAASQARLAYLRGHFAAQGRGEDAVTATANMAVALGFQSKTPAPTAADTKKAAKEDRGQKAATQSLGGATGTGAGEGPPSVETLRGMSKRQLMANDRQGLKQIKKLLKGEA